MHYSKTDGECCGADEPMPRASCKAQEPFPQLCALSAPPAPPPLYAAHVKDIHTNSPCHFIPQAVSCDILKKCIPSLLIKGQVWYS